MPNEQNLTNWTNYTRERRQQIKNMIEAGKTTGEIIDELKCCPNLIDKIRAAYDLRAPKQQIKVRQTLKIVAWMNKNPNESDHVIAQRFGVSFSVVKYARDEATAVGLVDKRAPGRPRGKLNQITPKKVGDE